MDLVTFEVYPDLFRARENSFSVANRRFSDQYFKSMRTGRFFYSQFFHDNKGTGGKTIYAHGDMLKEEKSEEGGDIAFKTIYLPPLITHMSLSLKFATGNHQFLSDEDKKNLTLGILVNLGKIPIHEGDSHREMLGRYFEYVDIVVEKIWLDSEMEKDTLIGGIVTGNTSLEFLSDHGV